MLIHIKVELPPAMHLPVLSDDSLHFHQYLCIHILVAEEQFLLLIDIPIQDKAQQLRIYQVFNLFTPRGNLLAWYDIDTKYLGICHNETKAIEILEQQFTTCQWANAQFCKIEAPLQPLANPPLCITDIYTNNKARIDLWCSLQITNTHRPTIPTPITSNLWILISTTQSDSEGITLICPDQAPKSIKIQKPIHIYVYHQPAVQHLNISTYHLAMRITRWWSTYHSTHLT